MSGKDEYGIGGANMTITFRPANEKQVIVGCGCFFVWALLVLGFWGSVFYIALHFILKFW
jgi:hypothetical protein